MGTDGLPSTSQLVDDMLDFTASAAELGKPGQGADLKLGLATAPALYAWEEFPELGAMIERKFSGEDDVERVRLSRSLLQAACAERLSYSGTAPHLAIIRRRTNGCSRRRAFKGRATGTGGIARERRQDGAGRDGEGYAFAQEVEGWADEGRAARSPE